MISVPVRAVPVLLVATTNVTVPLPVPGAPVKTAIHAALLTASHAQPDAAVTVLLPVPPSAAKDRLVGEIELAQPVPAAAACVTLKVAPAIVNVPERLVVAVLAATLKPTLPLPVRAAPLVTVIQEAWLTAVHAQPPPVVTVLVPVPPAAANDALVGEVLNVQLAAACVTLNVTPAIVNVPERLVVAVLAATLKPTLPLPVRAAPLVTVIQEAWLTAVHAHPLPAVTVLLPVPPPAANDALLGEIDNVHGPENENGLERTDALVPPGPTACTAAS